MQGIGLPMLTCQACISAQLICHSSNIDCAVLSSLRFSQADMLLISTHILCICSQVTDVFQGCDNPRGMLIPVAQQRRQSSTILALHLKGNADSADWESLVCRNEAMRSLAYHTTSQPGAITHPQGTKEVGHWSRAGTADID